MALLTPEGAVDMPAIAFFLTRVWPFVKGMAAERGE
jgi:hypothetical protein